MCKKHDDHGDAFNVARRKAPHAHKLAGPCGWPPNMNLSHKYQHSSGARTSPSHSEAGPPSLSQSERLRNCSLSYLFEQSDNVAGLQDYASWPLAKPEAR